MNSAYITNWACSWYQIQTRIGFSWYVLNTLENVGSLTPNKLLKRLLGYGAELESVIVLFGMECASR